MNNKLTDGQVQLFQTQSGEYLIKLEIPAEILDDLSLNSEGCVNAVGVLEAWRNTLATEHLTQGDRKICGYTINQLIFDTSIAYNPNKKKAGRKAVQNNKANKLDIFKQQIIDWLAKGISHCEIAKRLECHIRTLKNYIKTLMLSGLIGPEQCGA